MLPYELSYVYGFLPAVVLVYHLSPRRLRPAVLALASGLFLYSWSPSLLAAAAVGSAGCYLCALEIHRSRFKRAGRRAGLLGGLIVSVAAFAGYIYVVGGSYLEHLMLGVVLLSAFSYVMDSYRVPADSPVGPVTFLAYALFFGKLFYGPLVGTDTFTYQLEQAKSSARGMGRGVVLLFFGLVQLLVLAGELDLLGAHIASVPELRSSLYLMVMSVVVKAFYWYFRLSGFSALAQGTGLLLGLDLPRNHAYPFGATSLGSYFNRFLITPGAYARAYITPLFGGGSAVGSGGFFAVVIGSAFSGLFLGFPGGLVWGVLFGLLIYLERILGWGAGKRSSEIPRQALVYLVGMLSFVTLLPEGGDYVAQLTGWFTQLWLAPAQTDFALLVAYHYLPLMGLSLLFSTRTLDWVGNFLRTRVPTLYNLSALGLCAAMMALALSAMLQMGGR